MPGCILPRPTATATGGADTAGGAATTGAGMTCRIRHLGCVCIIYTIGKCTDERNCAMNGRRLHVHTDTHATPVPCAAAVAECRLGHPMRRMYRLSGLGTSIQLNEMCVAVHMHTMHRLWRSCNTPTNNDPAFARWASSAGAARCRMVRSSASIVSHASVCLF